MAQLMALTTMAFERTIDLFFSNQKILTFRQFIVVTCFSWMTCLFFAVPLLTTNIKVKQYTFQYICSTDRDNPIGLPIIQLVFYGFCLFAILISFGAIFSKSSRHRRLPLSTNTKDYAEFIKRSRVLHEQFILTRLILFLILTFILIEGPSVISHLFIEIRNSEEFLRFSTPYEMPRDIQSVLHWLKYLYPLVSPLLVCHVFDYFL
ncbi:hypothetical protein AB6A40_010867 [Gnathostoma spinigerum]|uniref:G-protein coupled receptors family 1 profile domain-containing protein n=1 Tax=Gnathostoma spinigerum TaxID=75299 RepID=A0ABD6EW32_9BILA